jgi:hypothetical protein
MSGTCLPQEDLPSAMGIQIDRRAGVAPLTQADSFFLFQSQKAFNH